MNPRPHLTDVKAAGRLLATVPAHELLQLLGARVHRCGMGPPERTLLHLLAQLDLFQRAFRDAEEAGALALELTPPTGANRSQAAAGVGFLLAAMAGAAVALVPEEPRGNRPDHPPA